MNGCIVAIAFLASACNSQSGSKPIDHRTSATFEDAALPDGMLLDSVLDTLHERAIAVATAPNREAYVVVWDFGRDSATLIQPPIGIGNILPNRAEWRRDEGFERPTFSLVHNYPTRGVVGTQIWQVVEGRLDLVYRDEAVCKPAQLRDVNGDAKVELIAFRGDTMNANEGCYHFLCYEAAEQRFGVPPVWIAIYAWNGHSWNPKEREYATFYADLANKYSKAHQWLITEGEESGNCDAYREAAPFKRFAERAAAIANSNES